ncbi:MAG TPA: Xaa-Pro peptidase family protein [Anaeromyxobacter sp.]|nr:Xaa-Pro peptidase family protein [Anaeromyxobacter sp.]
MDLPALRRALGELGLDGWLLYDFHGQNPTALHVLGLGGRMLTRRFFLLLPREGEPTLVVHAIERSQFPPAVPGRREVYASWASLRDALARALGALPRGARLAMEYFPGGAIPTLSRVDAGTLELVRSFGVEVVSSADLVQRFLCRLDAAQVESHRRALAAIDAAKDAAFARVGEAHRRGEAPLETELQAFLMERFAEAALETDHPPIVAVNGHAADPHYAPSAETPTPIRPGDLVLIDLWARGKGPRDVYADITWVGFCGERPPERLERIFRVAAEARDAGLASLRRAHAEGRTLAGFEVDRAVRGVVEAAGLGERFVHRTGHSIETRVHGDGANLDDLETHDTRPLVPGLCFSIEPGIYLPDEGLGVRTEIDVFLAGDGPEVYSPIQTEIVRI